MDSNDLETGFPTGGDPINDNDSEDSMVEHDVADTLTPYDEIPTPQGSTTEDSTLDAFLNEDCNINFLLSQIAVVTMLPYHITPPNQVCLETIKKTCLHSKCSPCLLMKRLMSQL